MRSGPEPQSALSARLFVELFVVIAVCEVGVMFALPWLVPEAHGVWLALADAFLLTITAAPAVYWRVTHSADTHSPAESTASNGHGRAATGDDEPRRAPLSSTSAHESADRRRAALEAGLAGLVMFGTGAIACIGLWESTRESIQDTMREELVRLAGSASTLVDPDLHESLVARAKCDVANSPTNAVPMTNPPDPEYERAVQPLRDLAANVPGMHYVYTMILDGDRPRFVLDAADPGDHDGDGVDDHSQLLEVYDTADAPLLAAFGTDGRPGVPLSSGVPYKDRWGTFLTGYAPIRDRAGRQIGVVGVDFDASSYSARLAVARNRAWMGTIPALLVALCVGLGVYTVRVRMLRSVRLLGASERRFHATADASPALVWSSDTRGHGDWFNRAWLEFTGRDLEDVLGDGWLESVHPDDRAGCRGSFLDALARRAPFHVDYRLLRADGEYRTVEDRGAPNLTPDGEFLGYVGMAVDVTDRLSAEQRIAAIAYTNSKLAAAVDVVDDALCVTDASGRITYVNRGFERQTGWEHDDVIGLRPSILKSGHVDEAVYRDLWSTILQGRTWSGRLRNRRRDQDSTGPSWPATPGSTPSYYWAETTITPLTDGTKHISGFVSLQRDITVQVDQEETARLVAEGAEARAAVASILSADAPLRSRLDDALRRLVEMRACGSAAWAAVLTSNRRRGPLEVSTQVGRHLPRPTSNVVGASETVAAVEMLSASLTELAARAAASAEICVMSSCADSHAHGSEPTPIRAHGHYAVPLMHAAHCEGVLLLSSESNPECSATILDIWRQVGELVALALVKERAATLLVEAMKKADAASRSKSEFLANMSHEIRTPLTAILGYADVLSEDPELVQDRVRLGQTLDTIRSAGQHLLSVVNDILDISKIEAGAMTIEQVDTNLPELLRDTVALLRPRAAERGLRLELVFDGPLPARARTDPTRLRQVLMNLAGNAVKFTETGGVTIRASVANPWGETVLTLAVEDTGPGLTPEQSDRLFHAFSQGDTSVTRRHGGTGLGLVICQRLSRLMGGDVQLTRTAVGVGTVFTATFRIHATADASMIESVPAALPSPRADPATELPRLRGRVLLAEDGRDNQRLISLLLRKVGAEVDVADNGRIAHDMLRAAARTGRPYDLLLTDVQMPEMDGLTLTQALRADGDGIPIVALTAHAMAEDRQRCLEAGCDGFATKPIDRRALVPLCARLLQIGRAKRV